jgi:RNA polymerase sigma-70 factor, ECF subfamily
MIVQMLNIRNPSSWTDTEIKEIASKDRQSAMEMIIRKYRDALYYHALCILKDEDGAYDLVQEVFIRAIREARFFNSDFYMKPWLYRVTSNLCFNQVRNTRRREELLDQNARAEAQESRLSIDLFEKERREEVMLSMESLSKEHKEVLLLRYYSDLSYAEIAQTLDVKLGTVMSRLSRARRNLLEILDNAKDMIASP